MSAGVRNAARGTARVEGTQMLSTLQHHGDALSFTPLLSRDQFFLSRAEVDASTEQLQTLSSSALTGGEEVPSEFVQMLDSAIADPRIVHEARHLMYDPALQQAILSSEIELALGSLTVHSNASALTLRACCCTSLVYLLQAVRTMAARFEACPLPQLRETADSSSASMSSSISSSISGSDDWATVDISTARDQSLLFSAANATNTNNSINSSSSYNLSSSSSSISATAASNSSGDRISWRERWGRKRGTSDAPTAATAKTAVVLGPVQKSAADAAFDKAMESVTCPICLEGVVGAHNTDCSCNKTFCGECILAYYSEFAVKRRFPNTCTGSAGTSNGSCDGGFACVNCNAGPVQKLNPILVVDALVADLVNRAADCEGKRMWLARAERWQQLKADNWVQETKEKVERRIRDEPVVDAPNLIPAHILAAAAAAATGNAAHTAANAETEQQQQQAAYDAAFDDADEPYDDSDSANGDDSVGWWSSLPDDVQYSVQSVFVVCAMMLVMALRSRKSSAK
eukprot:11603-Heterococcus_DN1.PRE.3